MVRRLVCWGRGFTAGQGKDSQPALRSSLRGTGWAWRRIELVQVVWLGVAAEGAGKVGRDPTEGLIFQAKAQNSIHSKSGSSVDPSRSDSLL